MYDMCSVMLEYMHTYAHPARPQHLHIYLLSWAARFRNKPLTYSLVVVDDPSLTYT